MDTRRKNILIEAERWAAFLRRTGYPEAEVAPEYCIGNEIGPDGFFTRTVSVYVGKRQVPELKQTQRPTIFKKFMNFLGRYIK